MIRVRLTVLLIQRGKPRASGDDPAGRANIEDMLK